MVPSQWRTVLVEGIAGVPTSGVAAVQVTFSAVNHTDSGKLYADKTGVAVPNSSVPSMIYPTTAASNSAIVPIGDDGSIQVMTTGITDVIVDMSGYYTAGATAAGGYVPVTPKNLSTVPNATLTAGQSLTFSVTGIVPATASAVMLNILEYAKDSTANAWATVGPANTTVSNVQMNWPAGQNYVWTGVAALPPTANGQVTISLGPRGSASFAVGVEGYFTATSTSSVGAFTPGLSTVVDTRSPSNPIAAGGSVRKVQVAGVSGVPTMNSGITAVAINLEIYPSAGAYAGGHVQLYADDSDTTGGIAVSQAFNSGQPISKFDVVKLGADGGINIQNSYGGSLDVIVDVEGWYSNPQVPSISCPQPYLAQSWTTAIPTAPITCLISAAPADGSGEVLSYSVDGDDGMDAVLSASDNTTVAVTVPAIGGEHVIQASRTDSAGKAIAAGIYQFTFGDWTRAVLAGLPAAGDTVATSPVLAVSAAADELNAFPPTTSRVYTVSANPDMSNPLITSGALADSFTVPAGTLVTGATYYWQVQITGATDYLGNSATILSPIWSFHTDGSLTEQDPTAGQDTPAVATQPVNGAFPSVLFKYGPCTLQVPFPHTRASGNYQSVGVKPITSCTRNASVTTSTRMYYQYWYIWSFNKGGTFTDSGIATPQKSFIQKNVEVWCNGTRRTWWIGSSTSTIVYNGTRYYAGATSVHRLLSCGA